MKDKIISTWKSFSRKQKIWICIWTALNLLLFILYVGPAGAGIFPSLVLFIILEAILIGYYTRFLAKVISPVVWVILYVLNLFRKPKPEVTMEWSNSIMFAVIVATFIKSFFIEAYNIPTPSMERSMMVGDFLFVSRLDYGQRLPMTPISFPFVHNSMPLIDGKSYTKALTFPYYRLPGFSSVKNGDIVVFNFPVDREHPVDKRENYIKRCIGIPGDSISVVEGEAIVNGRALEKPEKMQYLYRIVYKDLASGFVQNQLFKKLKIHEQARDLEWYYDDPHHIQPDNNPLDIYIHLTAESAATMKASPNVASVTRTILPKGMVPNGNYLFGTDPAKGRPWNWDNYGSLYVPKKGQTININVDNIDLYRDCISEYEHSGKVEVMNSTVYLDGKPITQYTFKMNYYFMMGDNRHNSSDSRVFGFVPEDHVVGKAMIVWLSIDKYESNIAKKIRWNRFFKLAR